MRTRASRALVIDDGSLGGLVGVWCESRQAALDDVPEPVLLFPVTSRPAERARRRAAERHAGLCGIEAITTTPPIGVPRGSDEGALDCLVLTHASMTASAMGIARVVWPVHLSQLERNDTLAGGGDDGAGASNGRAADELERIANACDRAMLAGALASVDARGDGVRIELPYADLTDEQIAELALDVLAPVHAAWWCLHDGGDAGQRCGLCAACHRWERLLGLTDATGPTPTIVTRPIDPSRIVPHPE